MNLWAWIQSVWAAWMDPVDVFDSDFPESNPFTDRTPLEFDCPDTQPSQPGALDGDL